MYRDPGSWPDKQQERERYQSHSNNPEDPGYRSFLSRILPPLLKLSPPPAAALDFGCGPAPLLRDLLRNEGYTAEAWDPLFHPSEAPLRQRYDIITATEVLEHLHRPVEVLDRLTGMLNPGGILAFMTQPVPERDFASWHYLSDLTHVLFFSRECFGYIADRWGMRVEWGEGDLCLLRKN